jgi:hypothetical protein
MARFATLLFALVSTVAVTSAVPAALVDRAVIPGVPGVPGPSVPLFTVFTNGEILLEPYRSDSNYFLQSTTAVNVCRSCSSQLIQITDK